MKSVYLIAAAGLLSAAPALANSMTTEDFVRKASVANQFEIKTSELALKKSKNDNVEEFARQMITDHRKTGEKLKGVLASAETDAKPATALDSKHQQLLDKLSRASAEAFDREYVAIQEDAHHEAVSLFSEYSKNGKDEALKNFAAQTLPTLQGHLKHVEGLQP